MVSFYAFYHQCPNVTDEEIYRTFNCSVGMVLCVAEADVEPTLHLLNAQGESASVIGRIETAMDGSEQVVANERRSENP